MYRVVIADDETLIRMGLKQLIDWESLGCSLVAVCEDGLAVREYLKQNPVDILVTDIRMPGLNGMELAAEVERMGLPTKIIFLTAYSEFSYAQEAIRHGVVEYLVKGDYIGTLPGAIRHAAALLQRDRVRTEADASSSGTAREASHHKLLKCMLADIREGSTSLAKEAKNAFPLPETFSVLLLRVTDRISKTSRKDTRIQILRDYLAEFFTGSIYETELVWPGEVAVIYTGREAELLDKTEQLLRQAAQNLNLMLCAGLSQPQSDLSMLPEAYQQAQQAMEHISFFESGKQIAKFGRTFKNELSSQLEKNLKYAIDHIRSFTLEQTRQQFQSLLDQCSTDGLDAVGVKRVCLGIYSSCQILLQTRHSAASLPEENIPMYRDILDCYSLQQLKKMMDHVFVAVSRHTGTQENYSLLVQEAINIIYAGYEKKLSVASIAQQLHVNKNYLGNLFKKETNESILEMMTRCRVEQAALLLNDPSQRISEISQKVGFSEPAYFTNVFTKLMGMSPKNYRDTIR